MKDPVTKLASFHLLYLFCCSECHHDYIGKIERTLWERFNEHSDHEKDSVQGQGNLIF